MTATSVIERPATQRPAAEVPACFVPPADEPAHMSDFRARHECRADYELRLLLAVLEVAEALADRWEETHGDPGGLCRCPLCRSPEARYIRDDVYGLGWQTRNAVSLIECIVLGDKAPLDGATSGDDLRALAAVHDRLFALPPGHVGRVAMTADDPPAPIIRGAK